MRRFAKKYFLQLFSEKPEVFGNISERMLSAEQVDHLRVIPDVIIGDISGTSDPSPLLALLAEHKPDAFLPTISYTGTEFGKWEQYGAVYKFIQHEAEKKNHIYVAEPVVLGAPQFWWALNGRFADTLHTMFGFSCRCLGCKLYNCALRIPLAKRINARVYAISDRSGVECSRSSSCLSAHITGHLNKFLSGFGLTLLKPEPGIVNRETESDDSIFDAGGFMQCAVSGNSYLNTSVTGKHKVIDAYFETFAIPVAAKVLSRTLAGLPVDYVKEAEETLRK